MATTTSREARSNSRSTRKKNVTKKNPNLLHKLKELTAEADYDEEIVSNLITQSESDKNNESRDHIITNSTVIPVLIYQTGYNSPTIVHSLEKNPGKRIGTIKNVWVQLEKWNLKMTCCVSHYKPASSDRRRLIVYWIVMKNKSSK